MVDNIRQAVSTSDRTSQGFSAAELTEGLARMALNDNNKCAVSYENISEECLCWNSPTFHKIRIDYVNIKDVRNLHIVEYYNLSVF